MPDFNSTMVQLGVAERQKHRLYESYFNSTMVQLGEVAKPNPQPTPLYFNSTMVQLGVVAFLKKRHDFVGLK